MRLETHPGAMTEPRAPPLIYIGLALSMSGTAFWGFAYTYFIPVFGGVYPEVSPAVHIHGWSFFLWFLLLPFQAFLMATGRRHTHMTLGGASLVLASVMVFTGILVASVRINQGLSATEPDELTLFWKDFGQLIMFNMVLFVGFYWAAVARRDNAAVHKRLIVLASASVLPAAIFRIIVGLGGYYWLAPPGWVYAAAFFLPAVFIVVGMAYDRVASHGLVRSRIRGPLLNCMRIGLAVVCDGEHGREETRLNEAGTYVIVPSRIWHTARVNAPSRMLFITAGEGTQSRDAPLESP